MTESPAPVLYIPHGGGPLPLLGDRHHVELVSFLGDITPALGRPAAIVVISAHWEAEVATVTSGTRPPLIHDYSGFPEEAYRIGYPVPGAPELAARIGQLLADNNIGVQLDAQRGFDHGLFVPLKLMYPDAAIPCVQLSLVRGLDPELHIRIGEALSALRDSNILVIGSGFSFHNMRAFSFRGETAADPMNIRFEDWLMQTCTADSLSEAERRQRLVNWEAAPHARYCHPREEHLLPLHVCYGSAGTASRRVFSGKILGRQASAFLW
jgi:aromatic ring-opening dioxygenase catalytic subunit (LigB family)